MGRRPADDGWYILNLAEVPWATVPGGGTWKSLIQTGRNGQCGTSDAVNDPVYCIGTVLTSLNSPMRVAQLDFPLLSYRATGVVWRVADAQDRVQVGYGNIIGQDVGTTPGYGTFALHAGWRGLDGLSVVLGIDNVFDRTYAEHLSRSAGTVPGYPTLTRVNEPGRQVRLRVGWRTGT